MVSSARAATSLALAAAEVSASSEARKRGAEQGALRAERQRGGKAAPVRDPAGCYHHHLVVALPHSVDDRRHERQRRARSAVPTGLRTLSDDDVGADINRFHRLCDGLYLGDQRCARVFNRRGKRSGIAEGEHDGCGLVIQGPSQKMRLTGE